MSTIEGFYATSSPSSLLETQGVKAEEKCSDAWKAVTTHATASFSRFVFYVACEEMSSQAL